MVDAATRRIDVEDAVRIFNVSYSSFTKKSPFDGFFFFVYLL